MLAVEKNCAGRSVYGEKRLPLFAALLVAVIFIATIPVRFANSAVLNLPDLPLFIEGNKSALLQLVLQRSNNLFYEAYPSYEDINSDGVLDITFKPHEIDYYGYFDPHFCYADMGDHLDPVVISPDKKCAGYWSGDFLNYITMTRMDVLRAALYGGRRIIDTPEQTRLRRAFVPFENHTWGVEYESLDANGYLISDYTPLAQPESGKRHLLATNNINLDDVPYLRVRLDVEERIWEWVSKERKQGDGYADIEMEVDVNVCKAGFLEEFCQEYPSGHYKPIGLLHEYGEDDAMYFGLLTGSFENNLQGGVVRQNISSFGDNEVNRTDGTFTYVDGIIKTLDGMQIPNDFHTQTVQSDCGWIADRPFENGECRAWGNPVAEMMYEGLRYFAGEKDPTLEYFTSGGLDSELGLEPVEWEDPYSASQPYGQCAKAFQLVISDPSPSFDGDQLPGSEFNNSAKPGLLGMHVGDIADFISQNDETVPGLKFVGEVGGENDGAPTPKMVTSLRNVRGISPDAPHRQGSYYSPSVAYFGQTTDLNPDVPGIQNVGNFTLALGSSIPSIDVNVAGKQIKFVPFARTIDFCGRGHDYKPTNAIVGFDIESIGTDSGSVRVAFEDMEQGADNDMDAVVRYSYQVIGGQVEMTADSIFASGCGVQHLGFSVSGSTNDGVYLVVRDEDTEAAEDSDYLLDVPPGELPNGNWADGSPLPLTSTFVFTPSETPAADLLVSPLWYAAKWGGFVDTSGDGIAQKSEWDVDDNNIPDNYFPVTNPAEMVSSMRAAFQQISDAAGSAAAVTASSGSLRTGDKFYRSLFQSGSWSGDLFSQSIDGNGSVMGDIDWSARQQVNEQVANGTREILTYNPQSNRGIPFRYPVDINNRQADDLTAWQITQLRTNPISNGVDNYGSRRLDYIRGADIPGFREREDYLGDIIHASPVVIAAPSVLYPDDWGTGAAENAKPYSEFAKQHRERQRVVYVGANDGMLHAFEAGQVENGAYTAGTGNELFAYIPSPVIANLPELTNPFYNHKNFVDVTPRAGDVFINGEWRTVLIGGLRGGGQGIYALDVTEPDKITEATAEDYVLWEFTDQQDLSLGYTYSSPLIARMANGRWVAILASGYNNSLRYVGRAERGNGRASIYIIDIETGALVRKLLSEDASCWGTVRTPNGPAEPTAIDLNGDNTVDTIYAGDLYGCVNAFDVSSPIPGQWPPGVVKHKAVDENGRRLPITTPISVGAHPSGEGVLLYVGTGKYLEPSDQNPNNLRKRIYALWDRMDGSNTKELTRIDNGDMLQQRIVDIEIRDLDTTGDGLADDTAMVRTTSQEEIDWDMHEGWYMDLDFGGTVGEQIVAAPLLRDGKILFTTHIPSGDECAPLQDGWFMVLDARSGAMLPDPQIDLDGDGIADDGLAGGASGLVNPFASPTVIGAKTNDVVLSQTADGPELKVTNLFTRFRDGRISWRELEP